jgi:hypothetical protein
MSALGEGPHKVGVDIARMPPVADTLGVCKGCDDGGGGMSALGEGPHKVGVDIARMPPVADTWVFAKGVMTEASP